MPIGNLYSLGCNVVILLLLFFASSLRLHVMHSNMNANMAYEIQKYETNVFAPASQPNEWDRDELKYPKNQRKHERLIMEKKER